MRVHTVPEELDSISEGEGLFTGNDLTITRKSNMYRNKILKNGIFNKNAKKKI
jgi:hypothetical protein